jgi:hypothetical protein
MVKRSSISISNNLSPEEIQDIAFNEALPRVLLRLSFIKDKEGNPVFGGIVAGSSYSNDYNQVMNLFNADIFSGGLFRITSSLTASILIKSIPLNSDIELFELGKNLEEQAIKDLESMIGIIVNNLDQLGHIIYNSDGGNPEQTVSNIPAFYFSYGIDQNTLPPGAFDKVIGETAFAKNVGVYDRIEISPNKVGVCWYYITSTTTSQFIESAFLIPYDSTLEEFIEILASHINEANITLDSVILASPNIGPTNNNHLAYKKREFYPNTDNQDKELRFTLTTEIHSINLTSRKLSPIANRELVNISLYTLDKSLVGNTPSEKDLIRYKSIGNKGISGIIYGIHPSYKALSSKGPHSLVIDVEKGNVTSSTTSGENSNDLEINTFYFQLSKGYKTIAPGELKVRVSSAPQAFSISEWVINTDNTSIEDIVTLFHNSFYGKHMHNQVLGNIAQPNSVQIVPFIQTDEEIKIIVDILRVPPGLDIATGTNLNKVTPYKSSPRSITVKARLDYVNYARNSDPDRDNPMGIGRISPRELSPALKDVRDKLSRLKCR